MKVIGFIFLALLGISYAFPPPLPSNNDSGKIHIPNKCSDVLAVKVCDNLVSMSKRLKLKAEDVTKAVADAVKQGKTSSQEIYEASKDFLKKEVLTKKCEDFTTAETCEKLRKVAAMLKIKASKVEELVTEIVAEGQVQAKEIYAKAMEYYKKEISTKTCEDFLSTSNCNHLRVIAAKLRLNMKEIEEDIKEAYLEKLGDAKQIVQKVVDVMKDYALNTKCEDLLNPDLCKSLKRFANATKVQFPVLMRTAVDLIVKGYDVSKSLVTKIYKIVDYMYDCEDIFDKSSCDRIFGWATKFGIVRNDFEEFVRKYVPIAIEKGTNAYKDFKEFTKQLAVFLKNWVCSKTFICDDNQASDEMYAFADSVGFFDLNLIKQKVLEYINIKYPGLETRVKSKVMSIFNKATSVSDLIKNAFSEILLVGGEAAQTIRKILEDLIKNIKLIITPSSDKNEDASDHFMVRRDIDLDVLRQKIKDFIEDKFPGLQASIKQKLISAVEKARSKVDFAVELVKAFWMDRSPEVVKVVKELIAKIKELIKTY